jgi:hypothetical protein
MCYDIVRWGSVYITENLTKGAALFLGKVPFIFYLNMAKPKMHNFYFYEGVVYSELCIYSI